MFSPNLTEHAALPCVTHLAAACRRFPRTQWPKRRHQKRRLVQPELATAIAARLEPSTGFVFLQSDVESLALEMRWCFLNTGYFEEVPAEQRDVRGWLRDEARPFSGVWTERERQAARRQTPVWRSLVVRNRESCARLA